MEWFVDGVSFGLLGESVTIESFQLESGDYTVEARAYDSILDHSFSGDSLDWWRNADSSELEQVISWNVQISNVLLGDVNLDGVVDLLDIAFFVDRVSTGTFQAEADTNMDGTVDLLDVALFVDILAN